MSKCSTCFVPNCKSGYRSCKERRHLFSAPKDGALLYQWQRAIPREDKVLDGRCRVCELHFQPDEIVKEEIFTVNGEEIRLPRKIWALKPGAVPSIFPGCPAYLSKKPPQKRSVRIHDASKDPNGAAEPVPSTSGIDCEENSQVCEASGLCTTSEDFITKLLSAPLPSAAWKWHPMEEDRFELVCMKPGRSHGNLVTKTVLVCLATQQLEYLVCKKIQSKCTGSCLPSSFVDVEDITSAIRKFDSCKVCPGVADSKLVKFVHFSSTGKKELDCWRSNNCPVAIFPNQEEAKNSVFVCTSCRKLKKALSSSCSRIKSSSADGRSAKCNWRFLSKNGLASRLKAKTGKTKLLRQSSTRKDASLQKLKTEARKLRSEVQAVSDIELETRMQNLDDKVKLTVQTIFEAAKCGENKRQIRYDTTWLMEALLLRIKSKASYDHVRSSGILPLPHPDTLRRLLSGMSTEFGFNEFALEAIKKRLEGRPIAERLGCLVWDEIKITKDISFNTETLQFDGFVDFGNKTGPGSQDSEKPEDYQLADHGLVFLFRSLSEQWVQPFGVFASRGAAPGTELFRLLNQAIICLENNCARVLITTCDGAQPNASVWDLYGITGQPDKLNYYIDHPIIEGEKIFFMSDVPHLFKCIRNFFFNKKVVQFQKKTIDYAYLKNLLQVEECQPGLLKVAPRLRRAHVFPTNFQRMNVKLMAQVFSNSVSNALGFYRTCGDPSAAEKFAGSEATEELLLTLNNVFDILNSRSSKSAITRENWAQRRKVLEDFLDALNDTEYQGILDSNIPMYPFLSKRTLYRLRVTLYSVIDVVRYLFDRGLDEVLTGRFNQDCLERFFGLIRAAGGQQDHPTVSSFRQLFRLLTVYYPTKDICRANVDSEEKVEILASYKNCLLSSYKKKNLLSAELKAEVKDFLLKDLCIEVTREESAKNLVSEIVTDNVIFYLGGYLLSTRKKWWHNCDSCHLTLMGKCDIEVPETNAAQYLTHLKNRGPLVFTSSNMFMLLRQIESCIVMFIEDGQIFAKNAFMDVMALIALEELPSVGCDNHKGDLIPTIIFEYVVLRFRFFAKIKKMQLVDNERTETHANRKKSKL